MDEAPTGLAGLAWYAYLTAWLASRLPETVVAEGRDAATRFVVANYCLVCGDLLPYVEAAGDDTVTRTRRCRRCGEPAERAS